MNRRDDVNRKNGVSKGVSAVDEIWYTYHG